MKYKQAQQLLGFTSKMSLEKRAELAQVNLDTYTRQTPLRYKVACRILIEAAR
ncbi:hypothetical protein [Vibrio sp. OPT18]|uniref:hypothetical protein n=1 Tax=Vibrio sp. OPT18 TaxID=2778641 RepID=UPI00188053A7|nr:hypothetical protein [Vibrio sp. OPT18]MBE8578653.1 hypothetical protein [Vibrio sp. OPT18]